MPHLQVHDAGSPTAQSAAAGCTNTLLNPPPHCGKLQVLAVPVEGNLVADEEGEEQGDVQEMAVGSGPPARRCGVPAWHAWLLRESCIVLGRWLAWSLGARTCSDRSVVVQRPASHAGAAAAPCCCALSPAVGVACGCVCVGAQAQLHSPTGGRRVCHAPGKGRAAGLGGGLGHGGEAGWPCRVGALHAAPHESASPAGLAMASLHVQWGPDATCPVPVCGAP